MDGLSVLPFKAGVLRPGRPGESYPFLFRPRILIFSGGDPCIPALGPWPRADVDPVEPVISGDIQVVLPGFRAGRKGDLHSYRSFHSRPNLFLRRGSRDVGSNATFRRRDALK